MNSTRELTGLGYDLTGKEVNRLSVVQMVRRGAYECRCVECGTASVESQRDLQNGYVQCRNLSSHGRIAAEEESRLTLHQFHQREVGKQNANTLRLEDEFKSTARKLALQERENVLTIRDKQLWIDPATITVAADLEGSPYEKQMFNQIEMEAFIAENPSYYPTPANAKVFGEYLERNSAIQDGVLTKRTLEAVFHRLTRYSLLEPRPAQEPQPLDYASRPNVDIRIEPAAPSEPETVEGIDPRTGAPRLYSPWEIAHMDSMEYRRAFKLTKTAFTLPNVGPSHRLPR